MNEPKVAITVLCAALLIPGSRDIAAQLASKLEAGQYTVNDGILPISAIRFAPTVRFELPYATLTARGSAFVSEQSLQLADGIVSGTFTSPTVYGVRAEMIGNASRAIDDRSLSTDQVDVQTRIHFRFRAARRPLVWRWRCPARGASPSFPPPTSPTPARGASSEARQPSSERPR